MTNYEESIKTVIKLNLKLQGSGQIYVIVVMHTYLLVELTLRTSKTLRTLRQYYKGESNNDMTESESFKSKIKIIANPPDSRNTKILKY